jgi:hypothetical protein
MFVRRVTVAAVLLSTSVVIGCGSGSSSGGNTTTQAGTNCGQPSGVPGEIVILQPMDCSTAARVAQAYYKSGKAPGLWTSGNGTSGWQCNGHYPGHKAHPPLAQCTNFSTSAKAQTQLAQLFAVRRAQD